MNFLSKNRFVWVVWALIPLVLIGIIGTYHSEARECLSPCFSNHRQHIKITDLNGNFLDRADTNQQVVISHIVSLHNFRFIQDTNCVAMNMSVNCLSNTTKSYVVGEEIIQKNYNEEPFVILFQVQNQEGITTYLSWVEGEINPNQIKTIESVWTPQESGTYNIVAFVWSAIDNPTALSPPVSVAITVRE